MDVAYRGTEKQAWKPLGFGLFKTKLPNREPKCVVTDYGNMRIERVENHLKEAKSATMNIFRNFLFSF